MYLLFCAIILIIISLILAKKSKVLKSNIGNYINVFLWISSLICAISISVLLINPKSFGSIIFIIFFWIVISIFIFWSKIKHKLIRFIASLPTASILDVDRGPILIKYWRNEIVWPKIMKTNTTYIVKISLKQKFLPFYNENEKSIEDKISRPLTLSFDDFNENAMVESGNLKNNHQIKIRCNAPAFFDIMEYETNIDSLLSSSISIPCMPKELGDHFISIDFIDNKNIRCGGILLPVKIKSKEPFFGQRTVQIIQVLGGILGLIAGIKLIYEAIHQIINR